MAASSIPADDLMRRPLVARAWPWRSLTTGLRAPPAHRGRPTALPCFGRLPAKEEMVLKGLSASLRCSRATEDQHR
jgi:hypothetical protein